MKSLRTRMTITIVLLVLGSSVFLSYISYLRAKSSLMIQLENNYDVEAQKYALELTSWINTNATILDTLAAEIAVNDIASKDYDEFHNYLKQNNDLLNKDGYVYDIYFTYPNNFMVCASDFIADGSVDFVHEREWYTKSALSGDLFVSTPYLDSDTKKPIVTISKAVYKDGKLLGVLAEDIFIDVLVDVIGQADFGENSYAFIIDESLRMIVHPNEEYFYEDAPLKVMDVPDSPYADLLNSILLGTDDMVFVKDYDGVKRGIVSAQMTNTGWYVCIATDEKEMNESVASLLRGFVIAALVATAIGGGVAIVLARVLDRANKQEQEYKQRVLKLEKQAADEASEAKSRFLADMSHEIRTPINAILGMNEMILRESKNDDILTYSQNIRQSGHNLLQLINGILDFSKIEDGKMEIVPVRYKVSGQIAYFYFSIADRAASKNLNLVFDIDPNLPTELFGDDTRINQVVINLLTNAVKYTEEGTVTLTVKNTGKLDPDGKILLYYEVKDTGIGIKQEDMPKLFESFKRLDVVRNRNIEGTGPGMNITVKLLELMNSKLNVDSTYGEGSVFSFELWQKVEDVKPLGDYKAAIGKANKVEKYKESFQAPDARILVVDDTKMNVIVVENLLKKTLVKIDVAFNGPDSIELCKENKFDLIFMDQRMPGMDGTETMGKIREECELNKETPIICLTADVIRGAKEKYIEMGFKGYLTKPVDPDELEQTVKKNLPADKVIIVENTKESEAQTSENTDKENSDDNLIKALQDAGVDTEEGLKIISNDMALYKEILSAYATEETVKSQNLQNSYKDKNYDDYGVYVHSLKSTSKTIGAMKLFEISLESEMAAKQNDIKTVEKNHDKIMKMYSDLVSVIRDVLNVTDTDSDDEILEFLPVNSELQKEG